MKKNFLGTILGSLALMLGFTSCKKDDENNENNVNCTECFTYSYMDMSGGTITYSICQDDTNYTQEEWDTYIAYYTAYAAGNPNVEFEVYEDCD